MGRQIPTQAIRTDLVDVIICTRCNLGEEQKIILILHAMQSVWIQTLFNDMYIFKFCAAYDLRYSWASASLQFTFGLRLARF